MVLSPLNVTLSHVNTTAKMREVLESVAGLEVPEALLEVGLYQAWHSTQESTPSCTMSYWGICCSLCGMDTPIGWGYMHSDFG